MDLTFSALEVNIESRLHHLVVDEGLASMVEPVRLDQLLLLHSTDPCYKERVLSNEGVADFMRAMQKLL